MSDRNTHLSGRAGEIFVSQLSAIQRRTDYMFAILFGVQWVFAIVCALFVSPYTWIGNQSSVHVHVWAAILMGGLLSSAPIALALSRPGWVGTRMTIAVAQMLYSALLIHLTGGRIETHFHVFGSLAFLAFYRDWRVFVPATIVVFVDHLWRGIFWPESVFGVIVPAPWRAFEHAGWVVFEEVFLIWSCITGVRELRTIAETQADLEVAHSEVEKKVNERTRELREKTRELGEETNKTHMLQLQLLQSQKLESIGQLAAGIAHEINTPMQYVSDNMEFLGDCTKAMFDVIDTYERNLDIAEPQKSWEERWKEISKVSESSHFDRIREEVPRAIEEGLEGIAHVIHVVRAMQTFSHPGTSKKVPIDINASIRSAAMITRNRWKYVADMELELDSNLPSIPCLPAEINQVLLNLIVNASDAVTEKHGENGETKGRILVRSRVERNFAVIEVEDTGCGISEQIKERIFDPFFTTKDVGKGTGQGLAISYNVVVEKHRGRLDFESSPGLGTTFKVLLPIEGDGAHHGVEFDSGLQHDTSLWKTVPSGAGEEDFI